MAMAIPYELHHEVLNNLMGLLVTPQDRYEFEDFSLHPWLIDVRSDHPVIPFIDQDIQAISVVGS